MAKLDLTDSFTENESEYSLHDTDHDFRLSISFKEEPYFGILEEPDGVSRIFYPDDFIVVTSSGYSS